MEGRKNQAKDYIKELMKLTDAEKEYLNLFEKKIYKPEILFSDKKRLENISSHPMAAWKTV